MSILIRHADIPKYGHRIAILSDGHAYYEDFINPYVDLGEVVPVLRHGRLIDADALDEIIQEEISKDYNKEHRPKVTWSRAFELFEDMVLDAPTIIPAEEGEK